MEIAWLAESLQAGGEGAFGGGGDTHTGYRTVPLGESWKQTRSLFAAIEEMNALARKQQQATEEVREATRELEGEEKRDEPEGNEEEEGQGNEVDRQ